MFSRENLWQRKELTSEKEDGNCSKETAGFYLRDPENSLYPKPLQFIDKAASCNAQEFSCSRTISLSLNKSTPDRLYLHLSKGLEIRLARCGGFAGYCISMWFDIADSRWQVFGEYDVGLGNKSRVF